jgi:hypothetical protein
LVAAVVVVVVTYLCLRILLAGAGAEEVLRVPTASMTPLILVAQNHILLAAPEHPAPQAPALAAQTAVRAATPPSAATS